MYGKVAVNEFIGCFLFYFTWMVVRYHASSVGKMSWASFYKPLLIVCMYQGAQSIGAPFFNGFKNPNLAFQLLFWNKDYYGYKIFPNRENERTIYENLNLGRYAFMYFAVPFGAALLAGFASKAHVERLKKENKLEN